MMKQILMLAGAATLVFAGPAFGKPAHASHGKGKGHGAAAVHHPANPIGYGVGGCPPGLAKKAMPCVPPGQAKKLFGVGQRVPLNYNGLLGYNSVPDNLRSYYGGQLDPRSRYIYDNSYLYRVDPTTMVVQQVLNAILR
jgi:hypothetical protein